MRILLLLALLPFAVNAQVLKYNCTTTGCHFITDPWPTTSVQPTMCRLYQCGAGSTSTPPSCVTPVVKASSNVLGPNGAVYCDFAGVVFPVGVYFVTATGLAGSTESAQSNVLNFQSSGVPPDPPGNLHSTSPTVP